MAKYADYKRDVNDYFKLWSSAASEADRMKYEIVFMDVVLGMRKEYTRIMSSKGNIEDVNDGISEAFTEFYEKFKAGKINADKDPAAYFEILMKMRIRSVRSGKRDKPIDTIEPDDFNENDVDGQDDIFADFKIFESPDPVIGYLKKEFWREVESYIENTTGSRQKVLKYWWEKKGWNIQQKEIAAKLGVSGAYISKVLKELAEEVGRRYRQT